MLEAIGCWNIRGLNLTSKQKEIKNLISENKLSVMAVLETQINPRKLNKICDSVFGNWSWITNKRDEKKTIRILVGWNSDDIHVVPIDMNDQVIHCKLITVEENKVFFCSFVYAENKHTDRRVLWNSLQLHKNLIVGNPWCLCGDFNVALDLKDVSSGPSMMTRGMMEFCDCVKDIEVHDLNSAGFNYTWNQKPKTNDGILKKLDRVMCNIDFLDGFPNIHVQVHPYRISDHCSLIIKFPGKKKFKAKPFKFVNLLANKPDLKVEVEKGWKTKVNGFKMYQLVRKLKILKKPIRKLWKNNGNLSERINQLRKDIDNIQSELENNPYDESLKFEAAVYLQEINMAYEEEEQVLKQKAKINWLKEGDSNSKFFHNYVKGRINKGRIETIMNNEGEWKTGEEVQKEFVKYFKDFLGTEHNCTEIDDPNSLFLKKLDLIDALDMVKPVTNEEIKTALFNIEDGKSPGPDGYTSKFFKVMWCIIGDDFCKAIKEFFDSGELLKEVNSTVIALIPKIKTPGKVSDFRPISCCSVIYKCISKILVSRISSFLGSIVSDNQSAFIPGRSILDNILLSQELVRGYHGKRGYSRCALKVDIQKAYDTVNWKFLKNILYQFGFHPKMINWIMKCVTTPSFMISINCDYHGFFEGLRQGCPLSPYLFTIVMEVFNLMFKRRIENEDGFKYHWRCKEQKITHLCFADDLLSW